MSRASNSPSLPGWLAWAVGLGLLLAVALILALRHTTGDPPGKAASTPSVTAPNPDAAIEAQLRLATETAAPPVPATEPQTASTRAERAEVPEPPPTTGSLLIRLQIDPSIRHWPTLPKLFERGERDWPDRMPPRSTGDEMHGPGVGTLRRLSGGPSIRFEGLELDRSFVFYCWFGEDQKWMDGPFEVPGPTRADPTAETLVTPRWACAQVTARLVNNAGEVLVDRPVEVLAALTGQNYKFSLPTDEHGRVAVEVPFLNRPVTWIESFEVLDPKGHNRVKLKLDPVLGPGKHDLGTLRLNAPAAWLRGHLVDARSPGPRDQVCLLVQDPDWIRSGAVSPWRLVQTKYVTARDWSFEFAEPLNGQSLDAEARLLVTGRIGTDLIRPIEASLGDTEVVVDFVQAGTLVGQLETPEGERPQGISIVVVPAGAGLSAGLPFFGSESGSEWNYQRTLPIGNYDLIALRRKDGEELARLDGVQVLGGGLNQDPRLNPWVFED